MCCVALAQRYAEGAEEIARKFFDVNAPIMVSAECTLAARSWRLVLLRASPTTFGVRPGGCWPFIAHKNGDDICLRQFPKSPTNYRYINSGMWGGRAYAAEDLIRRIMEVCRVLRAA